MLSDRRFAQLTSSHTGAVLAYARSVAADRWTAEDAVQETLLRAWKYRDSFRGSGSFEGWLIRICRNCLIDIATKPVDRPVSELPEQISESDPPHELYDLLARLPVHQREVVALCAILGYDYAGAAELLGVPIGTIRSRLHRARVSIAEQLGTPEEASA
jgi:RNA polymerase sigma-70 factor (ECF subfamily)